MAPISGEFPAIASAVRVHAIDLSLIGTKSTCPLSGCGVRKTNSTCPLCGTQATCLSWRSNRPVP